MHKSVGCHYQCGIDEQVYRKQRSRKTYFIIGILRRKNKNTWYLDSREINHEFGFKNLCIDLE